MRSSRRLSSGAFLVTFAAFVAGAQAEPTFFTARVAPILEQHCVGCHGPEKHKAGLRLDGFENLIRGAESGAVVEPGKVKQSELFRRVTLPENDDDVMPSDGKPLLSADEIKILELWIAAGASATKPLADFPSAPVPKTVRVQAEAAAPDWRPRSQQIETLQRELGVKLVPRSQVPTDGLILRTASAPRRCDDAALAKLVPIADLIVDAELARTAITDAGLKSLAEYQNLRALNLTHTNVTSAGIAVLVRLTKLETLNLTETTVDDRGVEQLKAAPALKRVWLFGSKATVTEVSPRTTGQ
jgi:hypothetical protein